MFQDIIQQTQGKYDYTSKDSHFEIKLEYESMEMNNQEDPEMFINTLEKL